MLVTPATWEAEAGESLKPMKMEVAVSQNCALASSLGITVRLCLKKKKKKMMPKMGLSTRPDTKESLR